MMLAMVGCASRPQFGPPGAAPTLSAAAIDALGVQSDAAAEQPAVSNSGREAAPRSAPDRHDAVAVEHPASEQVELTSYDPLGDEAFHDVAWAPIPLPPVEPTWTLGDAPGDDLFLRLPPVDAVFRESGVAAGGEPLTALQQIASDHRNFYSYSGMRDLAVGISAAAVLANTNLDENIRDVVLENITNVGVDEYAETIHDTKFLGNGMYSLPVFAGLAISGRLWSENRGLSIGGEWGERSLRTILVGAPPLVFLQYALGASRPNETREKSEWQPFQDSNGVSGHAFMGAVPLLSAAKMTDDPYLKSAFYVASTLPAISRLTDDDHYPSQVILGWWIAYLASSAVDDTQRLPSGVSIFPLAVRDGAGLGLEIRQ